jgi:hypothetical protein
MRPLAAYSLTGFLISFSAACDSGTSERGGADGATGVTDGQDASVGSPQTPPTGAAAVETWLAAKHYLAWHCEAAPHEGRSPSAHGRNRICTNDLLSAHTTGEYPVGAAAVKELYKSSGDTVAGFAVSLHNKAGAAGGDWYWYERLPGRSSPVADGQGSGGGAKSICVSCHAAAGSDGAHPGHDYVYTQVK